MKLHNGFFFEETRGEDEKSRSGFFPAISSRSHGCSLGSKYLLLKLDQGQDLPSLGLPRPGRSLQPFLSYRRASFPWEPLGEAGMLTQCRTGQDLGRASALHTEKLL